MKHGLFAELKRRHVYRVAVAYAVVGWLLIEVASTIVPALHLPDAVTTIVVVLVLLGFPVALMLTWAFEMTPDGMRRTEPADSPEARAPEQHHHIGRTLDRAIIGVLVIAVALLAWRQWTPRTMPTAPGPHAASTARPASAASTPSSPAESATTIPAKSIAVLPFENLSADKSNGYFADGMQDLILTKLADIGDLKVISRTSTMPYGSHPQNLRQIGQELGVATLLEGSVQKAGDQVLINVQLIDARRDSHIWADSYQRSLHNIFGVEGEVAEKIAEALKAKLSPEETQRLATALSDDPDANILFLRAEDFVRRSESKSFPAGYLVKAIALYRKVVARVPDFALAHARLSYAESWLAFNGGGGEDVKQLVADARAQAEQALRLEPNLPESHLAIGYNDYYGRSDYDAALKAFAAALRLRPNDADVYAARGYVLRRQGKYGQAIDALKHARALDPHAIGVSNNLAQTYTAVRQYAKAEQILQQALTLDPGNVGARMSYAIAVALQTGNVNRALVLVQGTEPDLRQLQAVLLNLQGKHEAAAALLERVPDSSILPGSIDKYDKNLMLGNFYRFAGDMTKARMHYAKALPMLRARLPSMSNNPAIAARTWMNISNAELGVGHTAQGIAAIKSGLAASERSGDHFNQPRILLDAARNYAQAKRAKASVKLLARALATPGGGYYYSPPFLWTDPVWDAIRQSPPFQALMKQYAAYRPLSQPTE